MVCALSKRQTKGLHTSVWRFLHTRQDEAAIAIKEDELMAYGWFSLESIEDMQDKLRSPVVSQQARDAFEAVNKIV